MLISKDGRAYRKAVQDAVTLNLANRHWEGQLRVEVEAFRPDNRKRDLDNLLKAILDGLAHGGVYLDDSQIVDLRIYWALEKGGKVVVSIEEIK
jgi:crossover junction endodeoxyribonuclease RusA